MSMLRRCLTVGILAVVLTTANAAPAPARDLGAAGPWLWFQDVWTQRLSALWEGNGGSKPESRKALLQEKEGPGVDPNGAPRPAAINPPCGACPDQGSGPG